MQISLDRLNKNIRGVLVKVSREAARGDVSAYIVGGVVRDIILKKKNIEDLDIVVESDAIDFARKIGKEYSAKPTYFPAFKTATLLFNNGVRADIATARRETYQRSGVLPTVHTGTIQDDLARRDFTINAMAVRLNQSLKDELLDLFGGLTDLKEKKIRILHDRSFIDDPTRILRAVRYEQRFSFHMERRSLRLLKQCVKKGGLRRISADRYFNDLRKILRESHVKRTVKRLYELGGLAGIDTELAINFHGLGKVERNIQKEYREVGVDYTDTWFTYFLAMIEKLSIKRMRYIMGKYDFTKQQKKSIEQLRGVPVIMQKLSMSRCSPSRVYELLYSLPKDLIWYIWFRSSSRKIRNRLTYFMTNKNLKLEIDGHDLKRLGITSGKRIGKILRGVLNLKLDGKVTTRDDELRAVRSLL